MQENENVQPVTEDISVTDNEVSLDHHSPVDHDQQVDSSSPEVEESDAATTHSSGSNITQKASSSDDQDIPEWGRKDPAKWGKYKERKAQKEYEKKLHDLQRQIEEVKQAKYIPHYEQDPDNEYLFSDPVTGMTLDARTEKGKAALSQFDLELARNEHREKIAKQTFQSYDNQKKQELAEQIEEAKYKYNDYKDVVEEQGQLFSQPIIDIAARLSNNGADFLYYLGKNPKELKKISNMPAHEQYTEILKHVVDYSSKGRRQSNAPDPIKPLPRSSDISGIENSYGIEGSKARMKAKYCK